MGNLSEDESSDSSDEFLVPAHKIDLNSSFFNETKKKPNPKNKKNTSAVEQKQLSSDESDDEFDYANDNVSSAELLAQVLKNFENANNQTLAAKACHSVASTSKEVTKIELKGDDLSKEISDLLLQGESAAALSQEGNDYADDSKEVDTAYVVPEKGVQIDLPGTQNLIFDRKKKKQQDLRKVLQRKLNSVIRTTQNYCHKVGLLCWMAHGFYLNKLANDPELLAISLSLISSSNYPKERPDLKYLEKFTKWFAQKFTICEEHKQISYNKDSLLQRVSDKKIYNYVELVLLYIATVRGMGINCRLVISLKPPPLKPKSDQLFKIPEDNEGNDSNTKPEKTEETKTKETDNKDKKTVQTRIKGNKSKASPKKNQVSPSKIVPENSLERTKEEAKKRAAEILKGKSSKNVKEETSTSKNDGSKKNQRSDKNISQTDNNFEKDDESDNQNLSIAQKLRKKIDRNEKPKKNDTKKSKSKNTKSNASSSSNKRKHTSDEEESDFSEEQIEFSTDEDYAEKKPKKKVLINKNKSMSKSLDKSSKSRKLLSSDEDEKVNERAFNIWIEVYVEAEESWISVSILDQKIHCVSEIYKKASQPILYVVAWNSAGTVKDVTRRYCPHWLTDTRKKRVEEKWWNEVLYPWKEKKTAMSKAEDEQLLQRELEQPLPKTISECKGHPLYALTRHLLKYEGLYPPDCVPLGHLKTGEAVYSRHCVHTLMSRETWVKKARVVKPGEQPYKIVKSMPKWDKFSGQMIKDQPLELFGRWQTKQYEPAVAKDGKVPRNEYGNVDLFKMCMLPIGTAYINLPGLNRVARKLNIDCAPACVGFAFGKRGALPAFEGSVVCEEYEDTLRLAWEEEQVLAQKRAEEKREKRIYGNWKKLIKGLLIREKLAAKYNFGDDDDDDHVVIKKKIPMEIVEKKVVKKKEQMTKKKAGHLIKILKSDSESDEDDDKNQKDSSRAKSKVKTAGKSVVNRKEIASNKQKVVSTKKSASKKSKIAASDAESLEFEADLIDRGESSSRPRRVRAAALKAPIKEVSEDDESVDDGDDDYRQDDVVSDEDEDVDGDEGDEETEKPIKKIISSKSKVTTAVSKRNKQGAGSPKKKIKR